MTWQIRDKFIHDDKVFCIYLTENKLSIDFEGLGLSPKCYYTGCDRGYMSVYSILGRKLVLKDLYIFSKECTEVNGIIPVEPEIYKIFPYVYNGLNIEINYTGSIMIVADYVRGYDSEMTERFPYCGKVVHELYFENGKILKSMEYSKIAEKIREYISENIKREYGIVTRRMSKYEFMMSCVSEEYKDKWVYNNGYHYI